MIFDEILNNQIPLPQGRGGAPGSVLTSSTAHTIDPISDEDNDEEDWEDFSDEDEEDMEYDDEEGSFLLGEEDDSSDSIGAANGNTDSANSPPDSLLGDD